MADFEKQPTKVPRLLIWLTALALMVGASFASYQFQHLTNSLLLYLPTALAIVVVHWYGYQMLPLIYINGIVTLLIWKIPGGWERVFIIGTHEPVVAFVSKFLVDRFIKRGPHLLSNTQHFARFTFLGIVVPFLFNSIYVYNYSYINGDLQKVGLLWLSDFITVFSLSLPLLYFLRSSQYKLIEKAAPLPFKKPADVVEFLLLVVAFLTTSFFVPFEQYWFIYGVMAVVLGIRQGFESVLLINSVIFAINYVLPLIESSTALLTTSGSTQLLNVHLGNATSLFVSTLVGRVVSDLRQAERVLTEQKQEAEKANAQLKQINQELDRFVYSVSHDLSAPLKSIQGLINLARMDTGKGIQESYLNMMERSANRLNDFIGEVLDYSKTSRKEITKQPVPLAGFFKDLQEKFILDDALRSAHLHLQIDADTLVTDPVLLKIAVGNIFSNALKFQKKYPTEPHRVEVKAVAIGRKVQISIRDNGEGIPELHQQKIFDMFYRATANAPGSGLGLYIAKEAVQKLGGVISVNSVFGEGSTFTIELPLQ
jgi:signal transduction histidine kinase